MKLCERRHCSPGQTMSHSKVREFSAGSFIQSYCPCMTLWPISMLSRIFDNASAATPPSQAGGNHPANNSTRPLASEKRCTAMTFVDVVSVGRAEVGGQPAAQGVQ